MKAYFKIAAQVILVTLVSASGIAHAEAATKATTPTTNSTVVDLFID